MRNSKLLESINKLSDTKVNFRRYGLSEIISESYKSYYQSIDNPNLQKLASAHLEDVRNNPTDTERLSRQLCKLKTLVSMVESKEMKDSELLVPEEKYAKVNPPEEDIKESKEEEEKEDIKESKCGDDLLEDTELTDEEMEELKKHLTEIRKNKKSVNEASEEDENRIYQYGVDLEQSASADPIKTEEELTNILKDAGYEVVGCMSGDNSWSKKEYGIFDSKRVKESAEKFIYHVDFEDGMSMPFEDEKKAIEYAEKKKASKVAKTPVRVAQNTGEEYFDGDNEEIIWTGVKESKSWDAISLKEFAKNSANKAFVRTFKKLDAKLREGTALTRQESISLYKAANSAMTHLSVELEHNPEFLPVFNESTTLLSADVARLLESMKNGKAPSKANMKSLAKFSEALLREDKDEDKMTSDEMAEYWEKNKDKDPVLANYKSYDEWYKDSKENGYVKDDEDLPEAVEDEELPPIEDEDEVIIPDEEVETEADEFDQEYADARVELHKELAEEHADDPEAQEKLAQDAEEIANLPGVTEEQIAEIMDSPESEEVEEKEEEEIEESVDDKKDDGESKVDEIIEDDSDITDEELESLKKYLKEMRSAKKPVREGRRLKRKE